MDSSKRPYGFLPALWIAMGNRETVVTYKEHQDPLCRWMMMSCIPTNQLDYKQMRAANGEDWDWQILSVERGYLNEIKTSKINYPHEVRDHFREM